MNKGDEDLTVKDRIKRLAVAVAGIIVLCAGSCRSSKMTQQSHQSVRTERIEQEVILLPETERLIISPDILLKMPPTEDKESQKNGLTLRKRKDGMIEIEHRRDAVRVREIIAGSVESTEIRQKERSVSLWALSVLVLIIGLLTGLFLKLYYK